jgi:hypothetical protein
MNSIEILRGTFQEIGNVYKSQAKNLLIKQECLSIIGKYSDLSHQRVNAIDRL